MSNLCFDNQMPPAEEFLNRCRRVPTTFRHERSGLPGPTPTKAPPPEHAGKPEGPKNAAYRDSLGWVFYRRDDSQAIAELEKPWPSLRHRARPFGMPTALNKWTKPRGHGSGQPGLQEQKTRQGSLEQGKTIALTVTYPPSVDIWGGVKAAADRRHGSGISSLTLRESPCQAVSHWATIKHKKAQVDANAVRSGASWPRP